MFPTTPRGSRSYRSLVVLIATVLITSLWAPAAAAWEPQGGLVYNNPQAGYGPTWKIINHLQRSIRSAKPGSRISISTFLMDGKKSADALLKARKRGVKVQIVMDGDDARTHQGKRLARILNRDNKPKAKIPQRWGRDKSYVVFCEGSCRGGQANNHSKFYVFTRTGTARNVVMVSSSNLNKGGAVKGWNDLYITKGNRKLVQHYTGIHAEMSKDTPTGDRYRQFRVGKFTSRFYPKPQGKDPVINDLKKVRCKGANGGAGRKGRTKINISMFAWNNVRGMSIARRLLKLDKAGCDVSIIYGAPSRQVRNLLTKSARKGGVKLWDSRQDRNGDGIFDLRVHHKYMLISGRYGGDRSAWRVHTGSQNWGRGTLRGGDENTLNIVSRKAYRQYMKNWNHIASHGSRRIGR